MALTFTKLPNGEDVFGSHRIVFYDVLCDSSYSAGGYAIASADVGLGYLYGAQVLGLNTAGAGFVFQWNQQTGKLQAFVAGTTSGTIAVTEPAVVVKGGTLGEAIGINPDTNGGVLSKAAATDRTIPAQTFFGRAGITAAFAGSAGSMAEVSGAALAGVSVRLQFVGF